MRGKLHAISFGGKKLYVILQVMMDSWTETSKAVMGEEKKNITPSDI